MKKIQADYVKQCLIEHGYITRNQCLTNYISRLGAIICDLKKQGWYIDGEYQKTSRGNDYKYTLISSPDGAPTHTNHQQGRFYV